MATRGDKSALHSRPGCGAFDQITLATYGFTVSTTQSNIYPSTPNSAAMGVGREKPQEEQERRDPLFRIGHGTVDVKTLPYSEQF